MTLLAVDNSRYESFVDKGRKRQLGSEMEGFVQDILHMSCPSYNDTCLNDNNARVDERNWYVFYLVCVLSLSNTMASNQRSKLLDLHNRIEYK